MADLTTTLNTLTDCVCAALEEQERAVCACGLTVGPPVIGPAQCCECGESPGGQASAFLERMYPADANTLSQVGRFEDCRGGPVAADISIVVTRCYPRINEQGFMPTLEETTPFAEDLNTDMGIVWNALKCCGMKLFIRESAVDADPEGGCSAFAVRVTTLVNP